MATIFKQITGIACLAILGSSALYAQKKSDKKEDNIIIRKKGDTDEKMTIVIDGDNITINGKPFDQYKDSSFSIQRFKHNGSFLRFDAPPAPFAPGAPDAPAIHQFRKGLRLQVAGGNKALLGVVTEKDEKGAKITEVSEESAAAKAGLQKDDIITDINDTNISSSDDLVEAIAAFKPEDKVKVAYLRNGKKATTTATLGKNKNMVQHFNWNNDNNDFHFEMPDMPDVMVRPDVRVFRDGRRLMLNAPRQPRLGVQAQDTEDNKGAKVLNAGEETPAGKAGIKKDDVITAVNGKKIQSVDELKEELRSVKEGDSVTLDVLRGSDSKSIKITFPRKLKTSDL